MGCHGLLFRLEEQVGKSSILLSINVPGRDVISEICDLKRLFWKMVPGGYFKQIWKLAGKLR